jgi:outer membrane lipoprotein SlyB
MTMFHIHKVPMRSIASAAYVLSAVVLASSLTACVVAPYQQAQPAAYPVHQQPAPYPVAQPVPHSEVGRVTNIEQMQTPQRQGPSGAGAVIGGIAGAVLGHQIGGGSGKDLATVLGAVGGAVAGNQVESNNQAAQVRISYRVTVQADNGSYRQFEVPAQTQLRIGDRVRMSNGQLYPF